MSRQESALRSLVMDIHKVAKKRDRAGLWYPGYYPGGSYFVCDQVRFLKCFYSEGYPLPSAVSDGIEEFPYNSFWDRNIQLNWLRVRLPSVTELKEAQRKYDDFKCALLDKFKYVDIKKKRSPCCWHFGGEYNYFNVFYLRQAIVAMKDPVGFIDPKKKWSPIYIRSEPEGTELLIWPVNPDRMICNPFYRCDELEILEAQP